ncbi:MAG: EscU/YscU/HrcU family type III secretion system export apparatus switch protein [Gemmatimonadota bacterium]
MALSDQEKTEAPTQKRREDSKTDGKIPKSQELTTSFVLLGAAMLINLMGGSLGAAVQDMFAEGIAAVGSAPLGADSAVGLVRHIFGRAMIIVGTWGGALMLVGLAVAAPQARGVFSFKPITPDFSKLSPATNIKRVLGIQSLADLFKSLLKLALISFAVKSALSAAWSDILALGQQPNFSFLVVTVKYSVKLLTTAGLCYLGLAGLDYAFQIWQFEQGLKMSRDEIKQETKLSEGDPLMKQRVRSFGRTLARRQMMQSVPKADVVITNPTHIAIALIYDPFKAPAPFVVAIGQRKVAERIKAVAREHGIPCIENKPLARALLASARVGQMIPSEMYIAVAEILAFVIRRRIARGKALQNVTV